MNHATKRGAETLPQGVFDFLGTIPRWIYRTPDLTVIGIIMDERYSTADPIKVIYLFRASEPSSLLPEASKSKFIYYNKVSLMA